MTKMAGFMIGHRNLVRCSRTFRLFKIDLAKPLVNIPDFFRPCAGPARIPGILCQENPVALEMRATSRRICDDCVQRVDVKRVNLPAGEKLSGLNFSIVGMQRTAAILRAWRVDLTLVGKKSIDRVPIDVGKDDVLHASGQHAHAVARLSLRTLHRFDELPGKS